MTTGCWYSGTSGNITSIAANGSYFGTFKEIWGCELGRALENARLSDVTRWAGFFVLKCTILPTSRRHRPNFSMRPDDGRLGYRGRLRDKRFGNPEKHQKIDSRPFRLIFSEIVERFGQLPIIVICIFFQSHVLISVVDTNTIQHCVKYNLYHPCIIFVFEL